MDLRRTHRLAIPALLSVSAVSALGCAGDDSDDDGATSVDDSGSESGSASVSESGSVTVSDSGSVSESGSESASVSDSGSEASTSASESSTGATDTGTESVDSGSTGDADCFGDGSMPACDVKEQSECEAAELCLWSQPGYCSANCTIIEDAATCCEQFECAWMGDACDYNAI